MKDYQSKYPTIPAQVFWVVNEQGKSGRPKNTPLQCQGFLGGYPGRPEALWFPAANFTMPTEGAYARYFATAEECARECLERLQAEQARLTEEQTELTERKRLVRQYLADENLLNEPQTISSLQETLTHER